MNFTIKQLNVFVAIAQTENMSRAADRLYLTQSACSMALTKLEEYLGGPIFDRLGKKLILNQRGRMLLPKAKDILSQLEELQHGLLNTTAFSGELKIGASTTIGCYILPDIISKFIKNYPQVRPSLQIINTESVLEELVHFNLDVAMIEGNCLANNLHVEKWQADELVIIASPHHPLSKKSNITLSDLRETRWILRETGSGTREKCIELLKGEITTFFEFGHTEAIKQAVKAGLGISLLSRAAVHTEIKRRELKILKTPLKKLSRDFFTVLHKERHHHPLLLKFLAYCRA